VDDDGMVLNATGELLKLWGCEVVACASGVQALDAAAHCTRPPHLLICDYRLPGPDDGLTVIERIRDEFNLPIPAVIVTGDVLREQLDLLLVPDVMVLHKPVSEASLRQAVQQMLGA
jgi:two-component system, sensor histidine kinase